MSRRVSRKKTLFTVPEAPDAPPTLLCGHCACGHVFFPAQRLGCERCGAHDHAIRIEEVPARGVLRAFATAYRPRPPEGEAPIVVGTVMLDAGPAFEVTLAARQDELCVGQRVHGVLLESGLDDAGNTVMDCRFAPEGSA